MRRKILGLIIITICLGFFSVIAIQKGNADKDIGIFFKINILVPKTCVITPGGCIALLLNSSLYKIGIRVEVLDHTGWNQIVPRTWDYPGPFPIPTYDAGGYDILIVGWDWDLDWNPKGLYDSSSIIPNGNNFYQYNSSAIDQAINSYTSSFTLEDRLKYITDIQALLYEDLPGISVLYYNSLYAMDGNFDQSSWDGLLWASACQPMENWSCGTQTTFRYATPASFVDFHPLLYDSIYDAQWLRQIYNGMLERNVLPPYNRTFGPRLASSWTSSDGLLYTVNINPTAVWADGIPLTAEDVNYTYNLVLSPKFESDAYFSLIKYMDNDSITIINDYQYTIEFKLPYIFQDNNLALDLLPKHIWNTTTLENHSTQALNWAKNNPEKIFGAGPYKLEEYDSTNGIIHLTRNDHFVDWSGITPKFEDVYFISYDNKESALADFAAGNINMVDAQFGFYLNEIPSGAIYQFVEDIAQHEIAINQNHPYLGTGESCPITGKDSARHVRQAINHIVPRQNIIACSPKNYNLEPGVTGCPHGVIGYDESLKPYEYNVTHALEHMALAGFPVTTSVHIDIGFFFSTIIFIITLLGGTMNLIHQKQ